MSTVSLPHSKDNTYSTSARLGIWRLGLTEESNAGILIGQPAEKTAQYGAKNTCFPTMGACQKKIKQEYRKETLLRAVEEGCPYVGSALASEGFILALAAEYLVLVYKRWRMFGAFFCIHPPEDSHVISD